MAAKRQSTKRTTATKRRPKKTTQKAKALHYELNIAGLGLFSLSLLALFQAGFVGTLVANVIRLFVGNSYLLLALLISALGLTLLIMGVWPSLKAHYWWGGGLALAGWLLMSHVTMFLSAGQHTGFLAYTWQLWASDLGHGSLSLDLGGGMLGALMLTLTHFLVAFLGSQVLAILVMVAGGLIFFDIPFVRVLQIIQKMAIWLGTHLTQLYQVCQAWFERRARDRSKSQSKPARKAVKVDETPLVAPEDKTLPEPVLDQKQPTKSASAQPVTINVAADQNQSKPKNDEEFEESSMIQVADDDPNYQLPGSNLLTPVTENDQTDDYKLIEKNTKVLEKTLDSFGVDAEIKHVNLGPSVTEYELHPAIGVKVSRIVNLADDLALAMAAKDIRIEAPIPGKSLIGIEVPNREVATVSFRDVSEAVSHSANHPLEVPLGRDVTGKVISSDLTKMPHLLIAGSTGSGKSVAINGIIVSILMNAKPSQVKLMLIDPKKVELSVYNGIPHLLTPVVSEPKKAARALHKVVHEMEQRYDLFSKVGQRKISGYNQYVQEQNKTSDKPLPLLPYIVVIVDELADLMMTVSNEVEDAIIRLAQMGRAAGIHMILATQRPSVDVITGLIKANVPSRMAFAVSSGVDSRTILDSNGAEKLLGRGDMLYLPIDQNTPIRVQGAFIPDQDVERVVTFIKDQQQADYDEQMMVSDEEVAENADSSDDELFNEALEFVVNEQKASTSLLQRHFRIGYNRAARLIDDLEQGGFIGPQEGSKPRQVYKAKPEE
ncbi:cell division protein FtsK [Secundilactobacillus kimchicus]|uniref:FtsK/SpoIIIE family DNA translocase n=1 Tax=Secundilactobacillus kimchicus TaxID=528209 RepID=UPI001C039C63|nr:DNA translocase FtsK [Secundilactobacillus kimchicus]MBT9673099.1 cell division protein FtsK [Secundilactobacillus kimchicus]